MSPGYSFGSSGYAPVVSKELRAEGIDVRFMIENGGTTRALLGQLRDGKLPLDVDVIQFNCGLHDIAVRDTTQACAVPIDEYRENLRALAREFRARTPARLVWASTTPVLDERHQRVKEFARHEANVQRYNAVAAEVMRDLDVPIHDLHGVLAATDLNETLGMDGCHPTVDGRRLLADSVNRLIHEHVTSRAWFAEARFGMFVHWGIYAVLERGEQVLFREKLRPTEYREAASRFRAERFDARLWADVAKRAGMRYAVLTTKHHDGYCLFDSAVSDFTAPKTAPGRDLIAEYVTAFRDAGLRVGFYYSLADWSKPAYFAGPTRDPAGFAAFVDYTHAQVRELCTNYGPIDLIWFDGDWPHATAAWRSDEIAATIRALQPDAVINNRAGLPGDFDTPEQHIKASEAGRAWEACMTSTQSWWGYSRGDDRFKTPREIVTMLLTTASGGGNLLYNVGPRADGTLPEPYEESVSAVGAWLARNREAIYGTEPCNLIDLRSIGGHLTRRGQTLYLGILFWPGTEVHLAGLKSPVRSARLLGTGEPVAFRQVADHLTFHGLPDVPPDPLANVIAIDFDGPLAAYDWTRHRLWGKEDPGVFVDWARG